MKGQRLIALFLLGLVLFNYPVLSLFSRSATVGGVPLLFAYLFAAWAVFIGCAAWLVRARTRSPGGDWAGEDLAETPAGWGTRHGGRRHA